MEQTFKIRSFAVGTAGIRSDVSTLSTGLILKDIREVIRALTSMPVRRPWSLIHVNDRRPTAKNGGQQSPVGCRLCRLNSEQYLRTGMIMRNVFPHRSPKSMSFDKHYSFADLTRCSEYAFKFGLCVGSGSVFHADRLNYGQEGRSVLRVPTSLRSRFLPW